MSSSYSLRIKTEKDNYEIINEVLGIKPTSIKSYWELSINEDSEKYYFAIPYFMDILENKIIELKKIKINCNDISIWYFYEYDGQCNMEFPPNNLKRIGENGITLCISCWQK